LANGWLALAWATLVVSWVYLIYVGIRGAMKHARTRDRGSSSPFEVNEDKRSTSHRRRGSR
jgi:hypothetical protein